jgi:hypothetical protein
MCEVFKDFKNKLYKITLVEKLLKIIKLLYQLLIDEMGEWTGKYYLTS